MLCQPEVPALPEAEPVHGDLPLPCPMSRFGALCPHLAAGNTPSGPVPVPGGRVTRRPAPCPRLAAVTRRPALCPRLAAVTRCLAGVEHRQLLDLAQKHFSGISGTYAEDAVPTLAPCRFTGSQVGCLVGRAMLSPGPLGGGSLMHTEMPQQVGRAHKHTLTLAPPQPPGTLGRLGRRASLSLVPVSDFPP